ncbi:MAG: glycoside hydrolase family 88 protein [Bacteroidota bacterium]
MKKRLICLLLLAVCMTVLAGAAEAPGCSPADKALFEEALAVVETKILKTAAAYEPGRFPHVTRADGRWETTRNAGWTGGLYVGMLWLGYQHLDDAKFKQEAERWTRGLEARQYDTGTHDLGFLFIPTFIKAYQLTREPYYRQVALQAAASLSRRYNPNGFVQAWGRIGDPQQGGRAIIDTMMNLPLLWWAATEGKAPRYAEMAEKHALTALKYLVREDGTSYHVVDFDPASGALLGQGTKQGFAPDSTWARGQAWGIYGFTLAYEYARRSEFRRTAASMAKYFWDNLPADKVPYWDFDAVKVEGPDTQRDSSAGAIAAAGFLDLAATAADPAEAEDYRQKGLAILRGLTATCLDRSGQSEGVLLHGCYNRNSGSAVDNSVTWGDYYYHQALLKALGLLGAGLY